MLELFSKYSQANMLYLWRKVCLLSENAALYPTRRCLRWGDWFLSNEGKIYQLKTTIEKVSGSDILRWLVQSNFKCTRLVPKSEPVIISLFSLSNVVKVSILPSKNITKTVCCLQNFQECWRKRSSYSCTQYHGTVSNGWCPSQFNDLEWNIIRYSPFSIDVDNRLQKKLHSWHYFQHYSPRPLQFSEATTIKEEMEITK